jgi:nickel transport protein
MKYKGLMPLFLAVIFLLPLRLYGHGVTGKVHAGGMVVSAEYDTGEAMSYAKVKVSAPGAELTFQSGRTDRNGRFCFFPDAAGDWKVVVDDEMGHRLEVFVPVDENLALEASQQSGEAGQRPLSRYQKALIGISTLFGISGILFWWIGRKDRGGLK